MKAERLDKILCGSGRFSRTEARAAIQSGLVTVDGAAVRDPGAKVLRSSSVTVRGEPLDTAEFVYYMLHKPAGTVSGAVGEGDYPPVTALLPEELRGRGLFCVGRLDADATGLLLLTDDGAYAHRVTSPRSEIPKTYRVQVDEPLSEADVQALAAGVTLRNGTAYKPAKLAVDPADPTRALVTVTEGKYHEVKNLMAVRGRSVRTLERVSIGGLSLDESLLPGQGRRMSETEADMVFISNC